jgi:hypothetical protein
MAEVFGFLSILIITALYISTIVLLYECVDLFFEAFHLIIHAVTERERDSIAICRDKRSTEEIRVYPRTEQPLWDSLLSVCFPSGHLHRALSLVNCRCASPALQSVKRFISRESPRHRQGGADPHSPQTSPHFFLFNSSLQEFLIHTVFYALNSQHTEKSHTKLHQEKHY